MKSNRQKQSPKLAEVEDRWDWGIPNENRSPNSTGKRVKKIIIKKKA